MQTIYRFSYLASVLAGLKNDGLTYHLSYYLNDTPWLKLTEKDLSGIPSDYDGNNYELLFDGDYNFVKAEKELA